MGDSYEELVEYRCFDAGMHISVYECTREYYDMPQFSKCEGPEDVLDKIIEEAHLRMLKTEPEKIADIVELYIDSECGHDETLERQLLEYKLVDNPESINQYTIYKSMCIILGYIKEKKLDNKLIKNLSNFIKRLASIDVLAANVGYKISNEYYRYLDGKIFGISSNDIYTVGHMISRYEAQEHKELKGYAYICHKDINTSSGPCIDFGILFKSTSDSTVVADIKVARKGYITEGHHVVSTVGYIKDIASITFNKDDSTEKSARKLAETLNKLAPKLLELAHKHPELMKMQEYGKKVTKY